MYIMAPMYNRPYSLNFNLRAKCEGFDISHVINGTFSTGIAGDLLAEALVAEALHNFVDLGHNSQLISKENKVSIAVIPYIDGMSFEIDRSKDYVITNTQYLGRGELDFIIAMGRTLDFSPMSREKLAALESEALPITRW